MKVVRILESPKIQEIELAQQVREMVLGSSSPTDDEDFPSSHTPHSTRQPRVTDSRLSVFDPPPPRLPPR
ncbi:hypothetical protein GBAR_LOCUS12201, partial [Geodia barretti]